MRRALEFLIPGDICSATGGYVYDRRMVTELRTLGWTVTVHALDASFPHPTPAALAHADRVLGALPPQSLVLIDGLALSAMPAVLHAHAARLTLTALIHMPAGADVENDPQQVRDAQQMERAALQCVGHVFVTGQGSLDALLGHGLAARAISMVEPGTDEASLARRSPAPQSPHGVVRMLCVATVHPLKGHQLLIDALAPLAPWSWQLTCVGSLTRSPDTVARLRNQLKQHGLSGRVALIGEVEPAVLAQHFRQSDLFVLATRFESYCMAVAEALAHGLPVVSTRTGAIPQLVGTQAGLLVAPGNVEALRGALTAVLRQADLRARLADGAVIAGQRLPRWSEAGARLSQMLERLASCC
jgi:glycosyltransferase involved in cell wall biosynthesis